MKMEKFIACDKAVEPVSAIKLTAVEINSFPRTGGEIVRFGDGIKLYTGRFIGKDQETFTGYAGDYLVEFADKTKVILPSCIFGKIYVSEEMAKMEKEKEKKENGNSNAVSGLSARSATSGGSNPGHSGQPVAPTGTPGAAPNSRKN